MARTFSTKTDRPVAQAARRLAQMAAKGPATGQAPLRRGPQPFGLHLTTALSMWLGLPLAWRSLKNGFPGSSPEARKSLASLVTRLGREPNPEFDRALTAEAISRARHFLDGVRSYRGHSVYRDMRSMPVLWQQGTTALRDYNPSVQEAPIVLVVPSLINRFDVLDLDWDHSFLRTLADNGLRPLVVDWDTPGVEEKNFSLTDYVEKRLVPIVDSVIAGNVQCHLMGYCMGGNLALALATLRPERIRTLTLLATPWDFHRPDAAIGTQFKKIAVQMEPYLQALGYLPADIIQSLFASFQPTLVATKFAGFAVLDPTGIDARHFVLLEDWLNDGVPLTAPVARECLGGWYGDNQPGKLAWKIGGTIVDPRMLTIPSYVMVPGRDRIVAPESAVPLAKLLPHATLHEPMTGHIGMIASEKAPQQIWKPMLSWFEKHV